jgi:hypothetical protein
MKIFGIGLTRTGTTSLTAALRILGYSAKHLPMSYDDIKMYDASTDTPVAARFPILDVFYPDSKFILTTRDKDSWIESAASLVRNDDDPLWLLEGRAILYKTVVFDREKFLDAYDKYHDFVSSYFKNRTNDLLVLPLNDTNKWKKLCQFLNKSNMYNVEEYPYLNFRTKHI